MAYDAPVLPIFVMTFAAFVLLVLTTFSMPLISSLYFLYSSQAGGVRFGIWGWCLDVDKFCLSPLQLGYTWEPEVAIPITYAHVIYPIAAVLTFFALISLVPMMCRRSAKTDVVFALLALSSLITSLFAFVFMIATWSVAKTRFEKAGFRARYGPLPWMSLVATLGLLFVTLSSGYSALSQHREEQQRKLRRSCRRQRRRRPHRV